jgi:hypothetical protein
MSKLQKYLKTPAESIPIKTTSVNITEAQSEFIKKEKIVLSELIREFLNDLMIESEQTKTDKKKGA